MVEILLPRKALQEMVDLYLHAGSDLEMVAQISQRATERTENAGVSTGHEVETVSVADKCLPFFTSKVHQDPKEFYKLVTTLFGTDDFSISDIESMHYNYKVVDATSHNLASIIYVAQFTNLHKIRRTTESTSPPADNLWKTTMADLREPPIDFLQPELADDVAGHLLNLSQALSIISRGRTFRPIDDTTSYVYTYVHAATNLLKAYDAQPQDKVKAGIELMTSTVNAGMSLFQHPTVIPRGLQSFAVKEHLNIEH